MAITETRHVPDMADATIPDDTKTITQVMSKEFLLAAVAASDLRAAYEANPAQWQADNPGEDIPPVVPHAEVADPDAITLGERIFVKHYFFTVSASDPTDLKPAVDEFVQVNSTIFPTLNIAAFRAAALNMHNARRAAMGLDPVP